MDKAAIASAGARSITIIARGKPAQVQCKLLEMLSSKHELSRIISVTSILSLDLAKPAYFSATANQWIFPESYVVDLTCIVVVMGRSLYRFALTVAPGFEVLLPLTTTGQPQ